MIELFNIIFVNPLINVLIGVYKIFLFIHIPYALGFSIIGVTALIRLILSPLTASQLRTSKKLQELNPHLSKLRETHKGDPKRLQQETMSLYQQHGVNPLGSCLPTLIQFLLFPALYSVLRDFVSLNPVQTIAKFNSHVYFPFLKLTKLSDPTFFGLPLGKSPSHLFSAMPLVLLIPLLTAFLQFVQSRMLFASAPQPQQKEKKNEADFQSTFQTQMIYLIPVTIGIAAYNFPIGLALYWNTFTIFAMIQQYQISGWQGLPFGKQKQK